VKANLRSCQTENTGLITYSYMHHFTSKSSQCLHKKYKITERTKNEENNRMGNKNSE
jgi:hypothetical protein